MSHARRHQHARPRPLERDPRPAGGHHPVPRGAGYDLCSWDDETEDYEPVRRPIGALLDDYFGIDQAGLEAERRALLDAWRSHQEA